MDFGILFSIPPVTRTFLGVSTALALAVSTDMVSDQTLAFIPYRIAQGEVWRLVTGLFYVRAFNGGFLWSWALHQSSSAWLESVYYGNTKAYAWRLILISLLCLLGSAMLEIRQPAFAILASLEYLSTRCHEDQRIFWFGLRISPGMLPFHHLFSAWLFQESNTAKGYILGIALGHLVLLMDDVFPEWVRRRLLSLPGEPAT